MRRVAPWLLAALVLALIAREARRIEWGSVGDALLRQEPMTLALGALLAAASYALFAGYDLVGRRVLAHTVPAARTLRIAAICYAFNLNFGALVGAMAVKLRLYGRAGLAAAQASRVIAISMLGNWIGYLVLGGAVLALAPPPLPAGWPVGEPALRALGAMMAALGLAWVAGAARRAGPRSLTLRGHELQLPGGKLALAQTALAAANWALMGLIVWLLLGREVDYPAVLAVLLLAAAAGVVTHVPAGLGVIEAVFVACLGSQVGAPQLLAALLAYRAVYYLLPLAVAWVAYFVGEAGSRPGGRVSTAPPAAGRPRRGRRARPGRG